VQRIIHSTKDAVQKATSLPRENILGNIFLPLVVPRQYIANELNITGGKAANGNNTERCQLLD